MAIEPTRTKTGLLDGIASQALRGNPVGLIQQFLANLGGGGARQAPTATAPNTDVRDIINYLEGGRKVDIQGNHNRASQLPSYAAGSVGPWTGPNPMFKTKPGLAPAPSGPQIMDNLFGNASPAERGAALRSDIEPPPTVRWHPNDAAIGLVPQSTEQFNPDGTVAGRNLYDPRVFGGLRASSTFEEPRTPIGPREVGRNPDPIYRDATAAFQPGAAASPVGPAAPATAAAPGGNFLSNLFGQAKEILPRVDPLSALFARLMGR